MNIALIVLIAVFVLWVFYRLLNYSGGDVSNQTSDKYNRDTGYTRQAKKSGFFTRIFSDPLPFDDEAITWCANFLVVEKDTLIDILKNVSIHYYRFRLGKRSGGYREISAPNTTLLNIQKTIYKRVLLSVNIHPAGTGFRQNVSVVNNAYAHLGKKQILKVDIANFFGSIKKNRIIIAFEKIGYPSNISKVLAELCVLDGKLPQGAATSPTLSNIVAYEMDVKLAAVARKHSLTYTRYADDLTFSGEDMDFESVLSQINDIVRKEKFVIQRKKTRFLTEKRRKIVTGISVSSGEKLTIPKAKKREIRKNVHYILTRGLAGHQHFIGSTDPSYLKRLIGYLSFWLMVEPDNEYVKKSITALKRL